MKTAIIVGRFQVPELTRGHRELLQNGIYVYDKTIIFIGITKNETLTLHNPLPYEARKQMIIEEFMDYREKFEIYPIHDLGNYPRWVEKLDKKIEALITLGIIPEESKIEILGSRDSVASKYKENGGIHEVYELKERIDWKNGISTKISGTKTRKEIRETYKIPLGEWTINLRKFAIWYSGKLLDK